MFKKILKWGGAIVASLFVVLVLIAVFVPSSPEPIVTNNNVDTVQATTTDVAPAVETAQVETKNIADNTAPPVAVTKPKTVAPTSSTAVPQYGVQTKTSGCTADQPLPDPACSPGAVLTTDTSVICVSGYTQTVRNVSDSVRQQVFAEYGISYSLHSNYEVDHIISLELGGSNDISNLYPESYTIQYGAHVKDGFENHLHSLVCSGQMSIAVAQQQISTNWLKYYLAWKGGTTETTPPPTTTTTSAPPPTTTTTSPSDTAYYTSSYGSSKYYYPASCSAWKSLSPSYLLSFPSLQELLAKYPNRTLSPQCS